MNLTVGATKKERKENKIMIEYKKIYCGQDDEGEVA